MHHPTMVPGCYVRGGAMVARTLPPRVEWAWDSAAACGDARDATDRERQLAHTEGCMGCARRVRAILIEQGSVTPHQHRIGKRCVPADLASAERGLAHASSVATPKEKTAFSGPQIASEVVV